MEDAFFCGKRAARSPGLDIPQAAAGAEDAERAAVGTEGQLAWDAAVDPK
ncbi:MAG: hypothetical protein O3A00_21460 [Planctomycetota bacterium]|nr:hypothetical protein [Planctomycetota bacterium]